MTDIFKFLNFYKCILAKYLSIYKKYREDEMDATIVYADSLSLEFRCPFKEFFNEFINNINIHDIYRNKIKALYELRSPFAKIGWVWIRFTITSNIMDFNDDADYRSMIMHDIDKFISHIQIENIEVWMPNGIHPNYVSSDYFKKSWGWLSASITNISLIHKIIIAFINTAETFFKDNYERS